MKKYQFKLQKVLDLKKIKETQAKKKLGEELREMHQREARLDESIAVKSAFDQRFYEIKRDGRIDPVFFRRYKGYQTTLVQDIYRQEDACQEQTSLVDEARVELQFARRKTQVFEKLEEVGRDTYWSEVRREEQKDMSEVALNRFRRRAEEGKASLVLLAICASGFIMGILTIGLLFAVGSLSPHRLALIGQIMRYRVDQWDGVEKDKKVGTWDGAVRVVGFDEPYLITKSEFEELSKNAEAWKQYQREDVDSDVVITKDILDHRRALLDVIEQSISRTRDDAERIQKSLQEQRAVLEQSKESFMEQQVSMKKEASDRSNMQKDKAQEEILQSFKSMDPGDVVNVLTAGKNLPDFSSEQARQEAVMKVAGYISKMGARERAGILQALTPEWAQSVVKHLEQNYPF